TRVVAFDERDAWAQAAALIEHDDVAGERGRILHVGDVSDPHSAAVAADDDAWIRARPHVGDGVVASVDVDLAFADGSDVELLGERDRRIARFGDEHARERGIAARGPYDHDRRGGAGDGDGPERSDEHVRREDDRDAR